MILIKVLLRHHEMNSQKMLCFISPRCIDNVTRDVFAVGSQRWMVQSVSSVCKDPHDAVVATSRISDIYVLTIGTNCMFFTNTVVINNTGSGRVPPP